MHFSINAITLCPSRFSCQQPLFLNFMKAVIASIQIQWSRSGSFSKTSRGAEGIVPIAPVIPKHKKPRPPYRINGEPWDYITQIFPTVRLSSHAVIIYFLISLWMCGFRLSPLISQQDIFPNILGVFKWLIFLLLVKRIISSFCGVTDTSLHTVFLYVHRPCLQNDQSLELVHPHRHMFWKGLLMFL